MPENVYAFPTFSRGDVFQVGAGAEYQCDTLMNKTVSGVTSHERFLENQGTELLRRE